MMKKQNRSRILIAAIALCLIMAACGKGLSLIHI